MTRLNATYKKFYGFGLSSKLFYKPTVRALDKQNIFFPMDIEKDKSNKLVMNYFSQYDAETKGKLGLRIKAKNASAKPSKLGGTAKLLLHKL